MAENKQSEISLYKFKLPDFFGHGKVASSTEESNDDKIKKIHPSTWFGKKARDNSFTKPATEYSSMPGEKVQAALAVVHKFLVNENDSNETKESWRSILDDWSNHVEDEPEDIIPFPYVHPQASWCVRKLTVHVQESAPNLQTFIKQCGIRNPEKNEPVKLNIKPSVFADACEEIGCDSTKNEYQFIPVKLTLDSYSTQGLDFGGGVTIETRDKDGDIPVSWGTHHAMVVPSEKTGVVATGGVVYRDRLLEHQKEPKSALYDACIEQLVANAPFMKWAPLNMNKVKDALKEMKNKNYYEIPVPSDDAEMADNVAQWLAISHYPRVLNYLQEEQENNRYNPTGDDVDPHDKSTWYNTKSTEKIRIPINLMDEMLARIDEAVDPSSSLMCVTHGVDVVFTPIHSWSKAQLYAAARDHALAKQVCLAFDITFLVIPCKWHDRA